MSLSVGPGVARLGQTRRESSTLEEGDLHNARIRVVVTGSTVWQLICLQETSIQHQTMR